MPREIPRHSEVSGIASAAYLKASKHVYEDSYRMLSNAVKLVRESSRGQIFAVFDGISSAKRGGHSAQKMAEELLRFYREPKKFPRSSEGIKTLLMESNNNICNWGVEAHNTGDRSLGGCAGTIAWIYEESAVIFHAGDTVAYYIGCGNNAVTQLTPLHQREDGAIYNYFGIGNSLNIYMKEIKLEEGDRLLLLSDGVTKSFDMHEIADIITANANNDIAVWELVRLSRLKGSQDDITAMLIEFEDEDIE